MNFHFIEFLALEGCIFLLAGIDIWLSIRLRKCREFTRKVVRENARLLGLLAGRLPDAQPSDTRWL